MKSNLKFYIEYYNLPILTSEEFVDSDFIESIKAHHNFVIVTIYDKNKNCLFIRDFNKDIGWEFPGGYLHANEQPEAAGHRIAFEEAGLRVDELQPIAIVRNIFTHDRLSIVHDGIAYMALSRDRLKPFPEHYSHIYTNHTPNKIAYQNATVFEAAQKYLLNKNTEPPYEEIESIKSSAVAYFFNKHFVKPISQLASRKIYEKIIELLNEHPKSILDASCGDSSNIVDLQKMNPQTLCVGNDISWKTISHIKKHNPKVIFTNHDVLCLPFTKQFDAIIFKNTLHHIPREKQEELIKDLSSKCRQLILIDINDPTKESFLSKLWNRYYVWFLDDQGETFLNYTQFQTLVEKSVKGKKVRFGQIKTIKGAYMYASVENEQVSEASSSEPAPSLSVENHQLSH